MERKREMHHFLYLDIAVHFVDVMKGAALFWHFIELPLSVIPEAVEPAQFDQSEKGKKLPSHSCLQKAVLYS